MMLRLRHVAGGVLSRRYAPYARHMPSVERYAPRWLLRATLLLRYSQRDEDMARIRASADMRMLLI